MIPFITKNDKKHKTTTTTTTTNLMGKKSRRSRPSKKERKVNQDAMKAKYDLNSRASVSTNKCKRITVADGIVQQQNGVSGAAAAAAVGQRVSSAIFGNRQLGVIQGLGGGNWVRSSGGRRQGQELRLRLSI